MALKSLLSFSTGELDPVLHDNVTLHKFGKGLDTARNVIIGKTGSILSLPGRANFSIPFLNKKFRLYRPPNTTILTQWGLDFVNVFDFSTGHSVTVGFTNTDTVFTPDGGTTFRALTEDELSQINFVSSKQYVYIFIKGFETLKFDYSTVTFEYFATAFGLGVTGGKPTNGGVAINSSSGYAANYAVSQVVNGQESEILEIPGGHNVPVASGQSNTITVTVDDNFTEIRVYRRPSNGGAYGYLGSSTYSSVPVSSRVASFTDLGSTADFTNGPISLVTEAGLNGKNAIQTHGRTGVIYQQRLLITDETITEAILASRPGYENNFYRDFPYDANSALSFKSGSGRAEVLRMVSNNGLVVFTTVGIFVNSGVLNIDNLALTKVGNWIIDETVAPLAVPDGVFFIDKTTNSVRQLIYSRNIQTYTTIEHSIFSNHIFRSKTITTWTFQNGSAPLVIVTFSDGTLAYFTYHYEHQMKAWTRGDERWPVEQVEGTENPDTTFYVVNKNGTRYIEVSLPRFVLPQRVSDFPEYDKLNFNFPMNGINSFYVLLTDRLATSEIMTVDEILANDTTENYEYSVIGSSTTNVFLTYSVGDRFRWFDPDDNTSIDFEIYEKVDDTNVKIKSIIRIPDKYLFSNPSYNFKDFRMFEILTSFAVPTNLANETVSLVSDGYVIASPNNKVESYPTITLGAALSTYNLPLGAEGAIIIVGRPIVMDIKTLNVTTLSQAPTFVESLNLEKLYLRLHNTRGLYIDNQFPENAQNEKDGDYNTNMTDIEYRYTGNFQDIVGNKPTPPSTMRVEQTIPGNWETQGQVAIRQVDPLHFEILSIIPDIEKLNRSNR